MNTPRTNAPSRPPLLGALLTLTLATACHTAEPEEIALQVERTEDSLRFAWEGEPLHHFTVVQCDDAPMRDHCGCNGTLAWGVGPGEAEKFHEVALEAPFIASPLQYGATPTSDRKSYTPRPLEAGRTYLVTAQRVGPCESNPNDCQQTIALGCQSFVW